MFLVVTIMIIEHLEEKCSFYDFSGVVMYFLIKWKTLQHLVSQVYINVKVCPITLYEDSKTNLDMVRN